MLDVKQEIVLSLQKIVKELALQGETLEAQKVVLQTPKDESHGDYSTNIALTLFAQYKVSSSKYKVYRTPLELAKEIASILNTKYLIPNTDRIEAVAPGFINFFLSTHYLTTLMIYIIRVKDEYGKSERLKNKKIMVEFTDPNPFKEFHIGHLYSNTVGEAICRLLEARGAIVKRANYQGDIGLHVAKAIYGLLQKSKINPRFNRGQKSKIDEDPLGERVKFLGECYAFGAREYEANESAKKEIEKINKQIYDKDPAIMTLYKKGREWSLKYFETIYKRLGTKFDFYYFESQVGKTGLDLVKEYLKKGVFQESKGAVIFNGEKFGLHNRVFINSLGLPTYETKDLGLAPIKYRDFLYDQSIIITATEQSDYFKVVLKALSLIEPELAHKTEHITHGVVRLPIGKMSSRTGNVITGEWLLDEAKRRIKSSYKEMNETTLEAVAVGAVKYALLKSGIGRDIAFNFDESISLEGNSGPYLQYTFARTQSLLAKAGIKNYEFRIMNLELETEESAIIRALCRFPEIVEEAGEKFGPNILCNYLFDLAQKFNLFYQKHKILGEIGEIRDFRLALTSATGIVIKNGLGLLGIRAPERM